MQKLWLYLHFPHLQLDALFQPEVNSPPIIVLDAKTNSTVQLNGTAYEQGIRIGMGLGTAGSLSQQLQVLEYRQDVEENKLKAIAEDLYQVTSDICLYTSNGLLLRVHNMLALYGGLEAYWQVLKRRLDHLSLHYDYATGHSPFAARLLARSQANFISQDMLKVKERVQRATLQQTDLHPKKIEKLNRVGIHCVADLLAIPFPELAQRFDIDLVNYLGKLTGEFQHLIEFFHPPEHFFHYLELLYEIENTQTLERPLSHLLKALEKFLRLRDRITQSILILFHQRDTDPLPLEIGAEQGEYQAKKWLELASLKLETLKLAAPVYGISLKAENTLIRSPDRPDLFDGKKGNISDAQLITLLQAKLGQHKVNGLFVHDDFRPEYSAQYTDPLLEHEPLSVPLAMRPSFLLPNPVPLNINVSLHHGPERILFGWWDSQGITRDYFIARAENGTWYWVFKTPQGHWFLHGVFS